MAKVDPSKDIITITVKPEDHILDVLKAAEYELCVGVPITVNGKTTSPHSIKQKEGQEQPDLPLLIYPETYNR